MRHTLETGRNLVSLQIGPSWKSHTFSWTSSTTCVSNSKDRFETDTSRYGCFLRCQIPYGVFSNRFFKSKFGLFVFPSWLCALSKTKGDVCHQKVQFGYAEIRTLDTLEKIWYVGTFLWTHDSTLHQKTQRSLLLDTHCVSTHSGIAHGGDVPVHLLRRVVVVPGFLCFFLNSIQFQKNVLNFSEFFKKSISQKKNSGLPKCG